MPGGSTPSVSEVLAAVRERFPHVDLIEQHYTDHDFFNYRFEVGYLRIGLYVQPGALKDYFEFGIYAYPLRGWGPLPRLWTQNGDSWSEALQSLDTLRAELLGMSHGLRHACGRR